jgi:hypothetical protein
MRRVVRIEGHACDDGVKWKGITCFESQGFVKHRLTQLRVILLASASEQINIDRIDFNVTDICNRGSGNMM